MVVRKPRVVIIGAGMAGLTAANKLFTAAGAREAFDLCVVEGGSRIGGRINTAEFGGVRIEMGATWIHGIGGSPVHRIAREIRSLDSERPWEGMDGFSEEPLAVAEGGLRLDASIVEPVSTLYRKLTEFAEGKQGAGGVPGNRAGIDFHEIARKASKVRGSEKLSVGLFLRRGLQAYWDSVEDGGGEGNGRGDWRRRTAEEAVFAARENTQRTFTSADDLETLDFAAESEYRMFPGEEITIAKGYLSVVESMASVLPAGLIQLGRKVTKIEWLHDGRPPPEIENGFGCRPVRIHFADGSAMETDHVIVTVSLGVLKAGIRPDWGLFNPPLPPFKAHAISRLGFGIVNKLFVQLSRREDRSPPAFPSLEMMFHKQDSDLRQRKIPRWMRRTASLCPVHRDSSVLLSWFAGKEALELERLREEEIIDGVRTTVSSFLSSRRGGPETINGDSGRCGEGGGFEFERILRSKWGTDPLFLGSYSYVTVGSSGDDLDSIAEPLPRPGCSAASPPLQILFAGEATHRTHYSTTHGAYFSGRREAIRLLKHYNCVGVSESLHH